MKQTNKMVCVIDCGTMQIRAFIAELKRPRSKNYQIDVLEDIECNVDMSEALRGGILDRLTMNEMVDAIENIKRNAAAYGVKRSQIKAVATSALRGCINADAVIEWIRQQTGIELNVIDNSEEARLYYRALIQLWKEEKTPVPMGSVLMLDIGSGATVTSLIQDGTLVHSVDEHFGTIRVFEQFQNLNDSDDFISTIDRFTHGAVRMILRRLPAVTPVQLVVTGGEIRQLARILDPSFSGRLPQIHESQLKKWYQQLGSLSRREQAETMHCDREEASRLLLVASVLLNLMDETQLESVVVPSMKLRDGLTIDNIPLAARDSEDNREQILAMGRMISERFGMDSDYAENTCSLATQLFDQTKNLHHLSKRDRELLEFSALVHDIGAYINVRNRHKHSMYLLQSVDLPGLNPDEVELVSHIVRYHRRATPQLNHNDFQALSRSFRSRVMILASLLRLAYGLDVERAQRIRKIRCELNNNRLLIHLDRRQIALERWSIEGKSSMFKDVFGLAVVLIPRLEE